MGCEGFIFLYRKLLEWEWYHSVKHTRVFVHLLLLANHKNRKWMGHNVKRGQRITSLSKLASETNLTVRTIRTVLKDLKSTNEVTCETNNKNTIITMNNYNYYQSGDMQNDTQATRKRHASDTQATTNNNDNNENNEKNEKKISMKSEKDIIVHSIIDYYKLKIDPSAHVSYIAMQKILLRLDNFNESELKKAIDNFANDKWKMENVDQGITWFFETDKRIAYYLELKNKNNKKEIMYVDYE